MAETLEEQLARTEPQIAVALGALARAAAALAGRLAGRGPAPAAEILAEPLPGAGIRWLAAPDAGVTGFDPNGGLALALEPLEGDPGASVGAPAGTLFSLRPALPDDPEASFLTPGTTILAAGAALYGPRCLLALAMPGSAAVLTLDPASGSFVADAATVRLPEDAPEVAADTTGLRLWDRPARLYLEDCLAGADGPRAADHRLHWTGCLAAGLHRILGRGGLLLAPRGAPSLPLIIHHAQPLAFIAEAAGGRATDGEDRLLEIAPPDLASRSPLVLGSPAPVARVAAYHDLPDSDFSPLFGQRGLFRF